MSDDKKFMEDKNLEDVTPLDLIKNYLNNTSEIKGLDDVSAMYDAVDRVLFLADVTEEIAEAICHLIRMWNTVDKDIEPEKRKPIKLYIDSHGGDVCSGFIIIDAIKLSKTPVYTINMGKAYSMGLCVFVAGHKRFSYPNASFLFHEGSGGMIGDAGKFKNFSKFYENLLEKLKQFLLDNTNMTPELYKEKDRDDWWFFVDEAIEYGFCDEILEELI